MFNFNKMIMIAILLPAAISIAAADGDRIAARVNDKAIYEKELEFPLPEGSFNNGMKMSRKIRLERAIHHQIIVDLLKQNHIVVPAAEIDRKLQEKKETPPSSGGCSCCTYPSLDAYLQANYFKPEEYRNELTDELGYEKYMLTLWDKACPPGETRKKLLEKEKPRLMREFTKISHIFFNVIQKPEYTANPEKVLHEAQTKANTARQRLLHGEDFAKVAKEVSEDANTKNNGGMLDCVPLYAYPFGNKFMATVAELKPGEYSQPVESPYGYHIIRRETMNDNDLLSILQETFMVENWTKTEEQAVKDAKVERCF